MAKQSRGPGGHGILRGSDGDCAGDVCRLIHGPRRDARTGRVWPGRGDGALPAVYGTRPEPCAAAVCAPVLQLAHVQAQLAHAIDAFLFGREIGNGDKIYLES
jgi:hypothetical protein